MKNINKKKNIKKSNKKKTNKKANAKIIVESCTKNTKHKKPKPNAIIYMKYDCPYCKQAYKTLVKEFGKSNVYERYLESKEIIPTRLGLKSKYKNTEGKTVPFIIINNRKFIGSNDELQRIYSK